MTKIVSHYVKLRQHGVTHILQLSKADVGEVSGWNISPNL